MTKRLSFILFLALSFQQSFAQDSFRERVLKYIEEYKEIAIQEQIRTGVPASIKLAQGVFETAAGNSELSINAYNHFGIKCKPNWKGQTYTYTDDAKDECFRKYDQILDSYKDHSDFLRSNQRYAGLFKLDIMDYKAWAHGLRKAGYATNPKYAVKLIKFIEEYELNEYTLLAMNYQENESKLKYIAQDNSRPIVNTKVVETTFEHLAYQHKEEEDSKIEYYKVTKRNGLKGFYAKKGDLLLESAIKNKIRYNKLLQINDLPDYQLEKDLFIYLEPKHKFGKNETHIVKEGYDLQQISQEEGIQLRQLRILNQLAEGEEPTVGSILYLQENNGEKPSIKAITESTASIPTSNTSASQPKYEYISKSEIVDDFEEEINQKGEEFVKEEEYVNIANEQAIEEKMQVQIEMQQEEALANEETEIDEEELSPLERLKRHMDKSVYGTNQNETKSTAAAIKSEESRTTVPARNADRVELSNNQNAPNQAAHSAKTHTVRRGDTAFSISKRYGISLNQLKQWNNLPNSLTVQIGQRLKVAP